MVNIPLKIDGVDILHDTEINALINKVQNGTDFDLNIARIVYPTGFTGTRIQNAINSLTAGRGGRIQLSAGTYTTATAIGLISNCEIIGCGRKSTLLQASASMDTLLNANNRSSISVRNMELDGNNLTNKVISITASSGVATDDIRIDGCRIRRNLPTSAAWGIIFWDTQETNKLLTDIWFTNNIVESMISTTIDQIAWAHCQRIRIIGNEFRNIGRVVILDRCRDGTIVGNTFGTFLSYSPLVIGCDRATVNGNIINTSVPVRIDGAHDCSFGGNTLNGSSIIVGSAVGTASSNITVCGNIVRADGYAIDVNYGARVNVSGNTVIGTGDHHVNIQANSNNAIVVGNNITTLSGLPAYAILVAKNDTIVYANMVRDGKSVPTMNGIRLDSVKRCIVSGNIVAGTVNGIIEAGTAATNIITSNQTPLGITLTGGFTTKVRDNIGFVSHNGGDSSISNGTTIPHGLGLTPSRVILVSQSALARIMSVTAKGATTFTVGVLSTTGTAVSNTRAYWYAEV